MEFRKRIMAPTAGEIPARENAEYLVKLVKSLRGELLVVHILDDVTPTGSEAEMKGEKALGYFKQAAEYNGVPVTARMLRGPVARCIIEEAEKERVDLIVMGVSEGRTVAEWIVSDLKDRCRIPVVVAPGGFSDIF